MSRKPNGEIAATKYSVRLEVGTKNKICEEYGSLRQALEMLAGPTITNLKKASQEKIEAIGHAKNLHRIICEASGYIHDEDNWYRDQCSLAEYIRNKVC